MGFWWWIAALIVFGLVLAGINWLRDVARSAPPAPPRRPYVPDEQRCQEPVDNR